MKKQEIEAGQRLRIQPDPFEGPKTPPHWGTYVRTTKAGLILYRSDWHHAVVHTAWKHVTEVAPFEKQVDAPEGSE